MNWAVENKMTVNLLKTVETVFHRPNIGQDLLLLKMSNISQVTVAKLLGLYLRHDINFSQHVDAIVATCSQRFYLLAQLQKQGLGISSLDTTIYSKLSSSIKFGMHYQFIMDI